MDIQDSVGRNARNNSVDVRIVRILLQQDVRNTSFPLPRWCQANCDSQTVMLIDLFQTRVVGMPAASRSD